MVGPLLTKQDQLEQIHRVLGSRHKHRGELFEPSSVFYKTKLDNQDLKRQCSALCDWLGIPRRTLTVRFESAGGNISRTSHDLLLIKHSLRSHAPSCAALIARRLVTICIQRKNPPQTVAETAVLIDIFTLEYGMGIVLLNGHADRPAGFGKVLWQPSLSSKNFLSPKIYAKQFLEYTHRYNLDIADWGGFLTPRARKLLPKVLGQSAARVGKRPEEVRKLDKRHRLAQINVIALSSLGIILIVFVAYVSSHRPKYLPTELAIKREKIDQLRNLHKLCTDSVAKKENQLDQSDFFISRGLEVDKNRCVSLRNKYNFEVDQYNQAIKQIKY